MLLGIKKAKGGQRRLAFTLVELLISIGIASLVAVTLAATLIYTVKSIASLNNYIILDRNSRLALDLIMADVRGARTVESYIGTFQNASKVSFKNQEFQILVYEFDSTSKTLKRTLNGATTSILTNCTGHFELSQAGLIPGSWNQYTNASSAKVCKTVLVNWKCTRKLFQHADATEDIVTAKILMRN